MNRKLTALGLVLVAAFAMSAMVASSASAQNKTDHITAPEEWTPTASNVPGQKQVFRSTTLIEKPRFECEEVTATTTVKVAKTVDTIAVTPTYGKCIGVNKEGTEASAFVDNGGCEYVFTSKTTTGNPTPEAKEHATVHIKNHEDTTKECEIKITATALKFKCAAVPNQEVKHAVRYEQGAGVGNEKDIVINATAHGIINTTEPSIACPTDTGNPETHNDGSYKGKVTVKGHNDKLEPVPLTLTEAATP